MGRMPHSDIAAKHDRLVWIDLEMTGLDPERHVIVEVAAVITDGNLNILGEGIDLVVHAIGEAEDAVLALINEYCNPEHPAPLAGNSIATDRTFIRTYMPRLDSALHYRMIDVSTIKELARRWHPRAYFNQPDKGMVHRALQDIIESIRELDFYRRSVFRTDEGPTSPEAEQIKAETTADYQAFL